MNELLIKYKDDLEEELRNILNYWMQYTIDTENGGFYGRIDGQNSVYADAPKGSVLNSRILWTFSAAYNHSGNKQYLHVADRAFQYIIHHFIDEKFGGVYWSVDSKGFPLETKKQVYALAFALYGISEYVKTTKTQKAKAYALELYNTIEQHSHDTIKKGYLEAFARDWEEIKDLRLSAKDANEKKSTNTHLHVLEAYANLYSIWPNKILKENIIELINLFTQNIIDSKTHHLALFFDEDWKVRSNIISYGHDIEAAWLVLEAAEMIKEKYLIKNLKEFSIKITEAAREGLDKDGGLWYEYEMESADLVKEKHWWPQVEAMVGFFNAWQITGNEAYLFDSLNNWQFVKKYILDKQNGEWIWGVLDNYSAIPGEDKVGPWKCPYHNARACLEIIRRINSLKISSNNSLCNHTKTFL